MDKFIKYNSTAELHKELTNILLLCTEDSSDFYYCYCEKFQDEDKQKQCDLCRLIYFLYDIEDKNLMDGLSPKKYLQLNYNNKTKLERFADEILPFFEGIKLNNESVLDFFNKKYVWSMVNYSAGETCSLTLEEVIQNDIEMVKHNLHLFHLPVLQSNK